MSDELIGVRVDVYEVAKEELYVTLSDEEFPAVDANLAGLVRVEGTVIPARPGVPLVDIGPIDYVVRRPTCWEGIERVVKEALVDAAEISAERQFAVTAQELAHAAFVTVHGELPSAPN